MKDHHEVARVAEPPRSTELYSATFPEIGVRQLSPLNLTGAGNFVSRQCFAFYGAIGVCLSGLL